MKNTFRLISKFFFRLSNGTQKLCMIGSGVCLISMVIIAGFGVFSRFVLHSSLSWNEEADGYLFVWLTCLGAAVGYKFRAHPSVEVVVDRFPPVFKKIAYTLADLIVLTLGLVLIISGDKMVTMLGTETASSMQFLSMGYAYAAIPAGGISLAIHAISLIFTTWMKDETYDQVEEKGEMVWEH